MKSGKFKLWNDDGKLAVKGKLEDPKDRFPLETGMSCSDKYPYLDSLDSWQQDILCGQL